MATLREKVVVVTGASSGIGRATALAFADAGAKVVVAARRREALETLADECRARSGFARAVPTDTTEEAQVKHLAACAKETFGRIDVWVWVNNAGVNLVGRFLESPPELFRRVIETNLFGYVHGARAALPYFHEQGTGVLINVGSVLSRVGAPYATAYAASKFGLLGFTESLRQEVRADGIRVCAVLPASIDTPLFQSAANYTGRKLKAMGPVDPPEKVARAIVSCALRPGREVWVGKGSARALLVRRLLGGWGERLIAKAVERGQFEAWPASFSPGNLLAPAKGPWDTTGGWRPPSSRARLPLAAVAVALLGAGVFAAVEAKR